MNEPQSPDANPVATTLTIEHSSAAGTIIDGTARGDGSAAVLKANRWRWGRSIAAWYVPYSRDVPPKRHIINATARALREAGFEVEISIDATPREQVEAEALRDERSEARVNRLSDSADRHARLSDAAEARADHHLARFAGGQPILVGHHSEKSSRNAQRKGHEAMERSFAEHKASKMAAASAETAANARKHRESSVTVANRIAKLEAAIRKLDAQRDRTGFYRPWNGDDAEPHSEEILAIFAENRVHLAVKLEHWRKVRAEQIAQGTATNYGPDTVHKGDYVRIRYGWVKVARANPKTVSVETDYSWTDRYPWAEVKEHRTAAQAADQAPKE